MSCNHGNTMYSLESFLILKKKHFATVLPIRYSKAFCLNAQKPLNDQDTLQRITLT